MDAMYSAIKSRRGGLLNDEEENAHQMPEEGSGPKGVDMKSLVSALSPDQKAQLLALLVSGSAKGGNDSAAIEKGGMGPGEEAELDEEVGMDSGGGEQDDIAESMISSSDKMRSERGDKPRNLGERMKFDLASKLKSKGK